MKQASVPQVYHTTVQNCCGKMTDKWKNCCYTQPDFIYLLIRVERERSVSCLHWAWEIRGRSRKWVRIFKETLGCSGTAFPKAI